MPAFSSAAWVLHDLGLATAIGGTIFGKLAFHPALEHVRSAEERDRTAEEAWRRYSVLNLLGHAAMAASWLVGRTLLSGREAGKRARPLTLLKDGLVAASLASGLASTIAGRLLGRRVQHGVGPETSAARALPERIWSHRLDRVTSALGDVNLAANAGVLATTSLLAMESGKSGRFAWISRRLP